jgi:glycosyltransferase EpsF
VESVVYNYYRAIDRTKVQFDMVIDNTSSVDVPREIVDLGSIVYRITPYTNPTRYMSDLRDILVTGDYRVVHSHMNSISLFTLWAAKQAAVPVRIAHSHSTAGSGEWGRNAIKRALRPFSRVFPTHFFACSEHAGRWLFGDRSVDRGQATLVRNAIQTDRFRFDPHVRTRVRHDLGLDGALVVGHVGRFCTQKNHSFLIDTFREVLRRCQDSVLVLVGEGELKVAALRHARALGIADSVRFLGLREDVPDLYQGMDVFALPSLYEGLPVVGVEAQCAGLPCVFSNDITKEAILSRTATKMIPLAAGVDEWAQSIIRLSSEDHDRMDVGEFIGDWDVRTQAQKLQSIYEDIAMEWLK